MCPVRLHLKHTSDGQLALEWPNWAHSAHGRTLTSLLQSCACSQHSKQLHQGFRVAAGLSLYLAVNVCMKASKHRKSLNSQDWLWAQV
jgi:hypothetical protein